MSSALQPVPAVHPQAETPAAAPAAPKNQQSVSKPATPQDSITISATARQALAGASKISGDVDHDGDNH